MTFNTIAELRAYVLATFTANGIRDITGPEAKDAFIGILDLISPVLLQELTVNVEAGKVGGAHNTDVIAAGTSFDTLMRKILRERVPPVYIVPVTTLASASPISIEIGSIVSPSFTLTYTQNDGGALVSRYLTRNGTSIATSFPYIDSNIVIDAVKTYQGFASHSQGACKNDSLGDQDCTNRITAGTVSSNSIILTPYRKAFYGTPVAAVNSSSTVRAMSGGFLNPISGSTFSINIPGGSQRVVFAYPATLPDVTSVRYREFGGCEIKAVFTKTLVNVEGADGFTAISYKVFTFEPIEAFQVAANYDITI